MDKRVVTPVVYILLLGTTGFFLFFTTTYASNNSFQKRDTATIPFDTDHDVIQSFKIEENHFSGVQLFFSSSGYFDAIEYKIIIILKDETGNIISDHIYEIPNSPKYFDVKFSFTSQANSQGNKYSLLIRTDAPPNSISLLGSEYDAYPNGALVIKNTTYNQDLAFFTYFRPSIINLIDGALSSSRLLIILLLGSYTFILGSFLTLTDNSHRYFAQSISYSILIGIAILPVLLFFLSFLKIELSKTVLVGTFIIYMFASVLTKQIVKINKLKDPCNKNKCLHQTDIVFLIIFFIALTSSVIQIKDLFVPNGLDGPAHFAFVETIIQKKSLQLDSIYHFGFHSNVYIISEIFNLSISDSILLFGQWLRIASGLSIYLLALSLFQKPEYAVLAASIFWFLLPFPAYLINWSRYPFLQGITLLPISLSLLKINPQFLKSKLRSGVLLLPGLFLSHYGAFVIFLSFVPIYFFINKESLSHQTTRNNFIKVTSVFLFPIIIVFIMRLLNLIKENTLINFYNSNVFHIFFDEYSHIFSLTFKHGGGIIWILGIAGFLTGLYRHKIWVGYLVTWLISLIILNSIQVLLLGHMASNLTNIVYFLTIPLCLLAVYFLQHVIIAFKSQRWLSMTIITISLLGSYNLGGIITPQNIYFSNRDLQAITWIKENTPKNSNFLISSYFWDGKYKPEDGGAWLTYFTSRQTIIPKNLYEYENPIEMIKSKKIDYVYIGNGYGNLPGYIFDNSETYERIYNQNGVQIYKVLH